MNYHIGIHSVVLVLALICLFCVPCEVSKSRNPNVKSLAYPTGFSAFFLFLSAILLVIYFSQLNILHSQDYYGAMQVSDIQYEAKQTRSKQSTSNNNNSIRRYRYTTRYHVTAMVNWEEFCGCSRSRLELCQQTVCTKGTSSDCSSSEYSRARNRVEACVSALVDNNQVQAYGDCNSCQTRLSIPNEKSVRDIKISGFFFLGLSVAIGLCAVCVICSRPNKRSTTHWEPTVVEEPKLVDP